MSGRRKHDQFFPAREVERVTWRDYAAAVVFALFLLAMFAAAL